MNETRRNEVSLTDNYIFELDDDVTRKPVSYKNRLGITISADVYHPNSITPFTMCSTSSTSSSPRTWRHPRRTPSGTSSSSRRDTRAGGDRSWAPCGPSTGRAPAPGRETPGKRMTRVFITGSADGLGRAAAQTLLEDA
jgi:hypothetical protein